MAKDKLETTEAVPQTGNIVEQYYDEKGEKSKENKANGGEFVEVRLDNMTAIKFDEGYGKHIKKGDILHVSDVALEIYQKNAKVTKVN